MVDSTSDLNAIFRALADPTRRAMLADLREGSKSVGALAEPHAMSLAGAAKHVAVLETAGLLRCERRGRSRICALEPAALAEAERWLSTYAAFWTDRLDALETALAEEQDNGEHDNGPR